jgi:hypothetical protein
MSAERPEPLPRGGPDEEARGAGSHSAPPPGSAPDITVDPLARLALIRASAARGHLCRSCHATVGADDVAWLLAVAEFWLDSRARINEAVGAFAEALLDVHRLTNGHGMPEGI